MKKVCSIIFTLLCLSSTPANARSGELPVVYLELMKMDKQTEHLFEAINPGPVLYPSILRLHFPAVESRYTEKDFRYQSLNTFLERLPELRPQ
jgi:hypothetical protein